jgi:hypothetical protein
VQKSINRTECGSGKMKAETITAVIIILIAVSAGAEALSIAQGSAPVMQGNIIAFLADEDDAGADLNQDGDTSDKVAQVYSTGTGRTTNTGQEAERIAISGSILALEQKPHAIILWNTETNSATGTKVRGSQAALRGNRLAFVTSEEDISLDLNGDGDTKDEVVRIQDRETLVNTKMAGSHPALLDNAAAFSTDESDAGHDLNDDGDRDDRIIILYDKGRIINTKITGTEPSGYRNTLAITSNSRLWLLKNNAAEKTQLNITGTNPCLSRNMIAYERDNAVFLYDLANGTEKEIGKGTSPWLDTNRLVFVSQNKTIILANLEEAAAAQEKQLAAKQQTTGLAVQQAAETNTTPAVQTTPATDSARSPLPERFMMAKDKPEEKQHPAYWFLVAISLMAIAIILLIKIPKWLAKKRKSFGF